MSEPGSNLHKAHEWLVSDQYPHGEWGRCEATNPTDGPRNFETSRIKPNIFTSSQAILALLATGFSQGVVFARFFDWLNNLRRDDGYWTSASGSLIPAGRGRGWSEVKNIRHTAKALDLLLMRGEFVPEDATILHEVLSIQLENGAFPQHPDGQADIWSTAYVMNFIIRNLYPINISKSLPRKTTEKKWAVNLRSHLDRARAWICSQISGDGLWHLADVDPLWITEALLSEVGADLSLNRPDLCVQIANHLLDSIDRTKTLAIWGLLLILHTLQADQQRSVLNLLHDFEREDLPKDTFDVSSYCKLLWLRDQPHILSYYILESMGHESTLSSWSPWKHSEYSRWCIEKTINEIANGKPTFKIAPANKAEAWCTAAYLLNCFKEQIEENRGWELLWVDDKTPRNERAVQINFWNVVTPICRESGLLIREPDTGSGPVDFEFINGFHERIHIEFKLASNGRLEHGLKVQLPSYMRAQNIDSAFFVIVGFDEGDISKYELIAEAAHERLTHDPKCYIQCFYVDASRHKSASKR